MKSNKQKSLLRQLQLNVGYFNFFGRKNYLFLSSIQSAARILYLCPPPLEVIPSTPNLRKRLFWIRFLIRNFELIVNKFNKNFIPNNSVVKNNVKNWNFDEFAVLLLRNWKHITQRTCVDHKLNIFPNFNYLNMNMTNKLTLKKQL